MPMPHRGRRQQLTIRLPYDDYREAAIRARQRGWSMSDFIAWCVAQELDAHPVLGLSKSKPPKTKART